ncbi:MAG: hypothetical protein HC860_26780 [Alkalinema sp. RU_4_3]|nr:hypothetical protein [Alkalinema sp. RU_4_3]
MSGLLETATGHYGETLASANRQELVAILSAIALELECRHPYIVTKVLEQLHSQATEASDTELLTLGIAAAIRLRLPKVPIAVIPAVNRHAA